MEKELNILAILKDEPKGTKLWSPIFGECTFDKITCDGSAIGIRTKRKVPEVFYANGKYDDDGECMLFPSKLMCNWSKFSWKKGDVLIYNEGVKPLYCIFESFENNEYTSFKSRFVCNGEGKNHWLQFNTQSSTNHYWKVSDDEAKEFIEKVEAHYNGKLNLSTLEIEQTKPEFKECDIVFVKGETKDSNSIGIVMNAGNGFNYHYWANFFYRTDVLSVAESYDDYVVGHSCYEEVRKANKSEKQQLFDALAKEGKKWNPNTKQIEDLSKSCEFKPFDKVLVRITKVCEWNLNFFSYDRGVNNPYRYECVSGSYSECIPYNNQTAHLLGTTDEWKGGEG